ncbi:MAG TPA: TIGR03118 family protein [Candidatus Kapabacteria bacterium]|nr:TIGR03118 family protein [Candidatus Kapabacteria bacterium]
MLRNYRIYLLGAIAMLASSCHSSTTPPPVVAPSTFLVTPLTADKANASSYGTVATGNIDTNLQDSWGLAFNTKFGVPWVANRASATLTIYDTTGARKTQVYHVTDQNSMKGSPTGLVFDSTSSFFIPAAGIGANWIVAELNGTIAAVDGGDTTYLLVDRHSSSSFTGLAFAKAGGTPYLYATDVQYSSLDRFGTSYGAPTTFTNPHYNAGFAPFNVVVIDTQMFVTYAKANTTSPYFEIGSYLGGYVDIYSLDGSNPRTLISNDSLDQPWGVAIAPPNFGTYSGDLLVGNFGDGHIHAYNRSTGALVGTLNDASGAPIVINGLWALVVYNGTLYYTAGPNAGADGVFGTISVR